MPKPLEPLVIDNFNGSMTVFQNGDINSGRSFELNVAGYNPFLKPGTLTWSSAPIQIDSAGSIITDLVLAGKERVESGILYVYAIGHTGRVYKIQVNDPTTYNPNYDNPVLLATLSSGTPTFTRGGFIDFFGTTERIYIGHDKGVTRLDFDGTGESAISGTWVQNVPRPLKQFIGKLYIGNGNNLAEIDSTGTVVTSTKLSPAFPPNTQVRDIDLSPDGTYLEAIVTRLTLPDITSATQDVTSTANSDSSIFKWNGIDTGYTSFVTYPSFSLNANTLFQNYQYVFGYDQFGMAMYNPIEKIVSLGKAMSPDPNAVASAGNLLMWLAPLYYNGMLEIDLFAWGSLDFEVGRTEIGAGFYDLMFLNASSPETDIIRSPFMLSVSNAAQGSSSNGYTNNAYGFPKIYFSTLETSSTPTTDYKFYKWTPIANPNFSSGNIITNAVYQTQTQLFSKKVRVGEVRIYSEGWLADNSFHIDLIGSDRSAITNSGQTFTTGSNLTIGDDFAWYTPPIEPTYAIGVMITNLGTSNFVINKIEIDYAPAGK